jgi:hypothetical protein
MQQKSGTVVRLLAFFTADGEAATGLTVTVDVYEGASEVVTAGSATELGDGWYYYDRTLASDAAVLATFKTAGTADQAHIPAIGYDVVKLVQPESPTAGTLAAEVAAKLDTADYTEPPTDYAKAGDAMTLTSAYDNAKDDVLTPLGVVDAAVTALGTPLQAADYTEPPTDYAKAGDAMTLTSAYDNAKDDVLTPLSQLLDDTSLVEAWILNKLERIDNMDGTVTINLYESDGVTVDKTWTVDKTTGTRSAAVRRPAPGIRV